MPVPSTPDRGLADTPAAEAPSVISTSEPGSAPLEMNARGTALTIIAGAAVIAILQWAQEVFIPIVLSVVISYALEPVVLALIRMRLPRILASALVVASLVGALGYGVYTLNDDVAALTAELPGAAQKLRRALRADGDAAPGAIEQVKKAAIELQKTADEAARIPLPSGVSRVQIESPAIDVRSYLYWGSVNAVAFLAQAVVVVFFVFFLLASGDLYKRKLVKLAGPSLAKKRIAVQIFDEVNRQIEYFFFVRIVTSVVVALVTWLAFLYIGLEQAALWGIAAGVFNTIPYIGPVLVSAATAVIAFVQFGTISMALYASGISVVITSLEGWLITPWLTSRTVRMNEVAVFVGVIFWSWLWGVWGALLAVPMLAVMKAYCDRIEDFQPIGELLGADPSSNVKVRSSK